MHQETTVVVRHVPQFLGRDQMDSLFASFGATGARVLAPKTKKTATAFVNFRSLPEAQCAVTRLHQMDIRGFRLSAELSNKTILDDRIPEGQSDLVQHKEAHYLTLLKRLGLDKCPPNGLKYKYPEPTLYVLLNIMSALVEHKKFYTQVLHLMNKMNLPCPFKQQYERLELVNRLFLHKHSSGFSETQLEASLDELVDILEEEEKHQNKTYQSDKRQVDPSHPPEHKEADQREELGDISAQELVEQSESDTENEEMESELEEDEEEEREAGEIERTSNMAALKKALERKKGKGVKRPKFIKPMLTGQKAVKRKLGLDSEVFETRTPSSAQRRKIQVNVSSDLSSITSESEPTPIESKESELLSLKRHALTSSSERKVSQKSFMEFTSNPQKIGQSSQSKSDAYEPISVPKSALTDQTPSVQNPIEPGKDSPHGKVKDTSIPPKNTLTTEKDLSKKAFSLVAENPCIESSSVPSKTGLETKACQDDDGESGADEESRTTCVISKQQLDENRLGERDRSFVKAFNNYSPGTPSCRLYVKNLAKQVTQTELEYIYRRYYLPDYNEQGTMFDIRLMQEGRMKGQAFVTLQTIQQAKQALEETNGYIIKDKPMVVQFARSIQAKPV
uniref:RNA-binding region-containing protein 3 n=1 Tax=Cacopsylla melanoneura TaxID=428564 RepID=A0A8D8PZ18_9HEMI